MRVAFAILATTLVAAGPAAAQDKPSIESFFKLPQYGAMRLSPDGERIVALAPVLGHQNLVVIDVHGRKAAPITGFTDRDVVDVRWINNRRVAYYTGRLGEVDAFQRGGGIFAIDIDGTANRLISESVDETRANGVRFVLRPVTILRTLPGDTEDIIVHETTYSAGQQPRSGPLYRMDSRTGRKTDLSIGKPDRALAEAWIVDRNGVARAFQASDEESTRIYYRASTEAPWQKLDEFKRLAGNTWSPVALSPDEDTLWVSSRKGRDKPAIIRYDVATNSFGEVIAEHPGVDLSDLRGDKQGVRGVHYEADRGATAWFDENLARAQSMIDKALAGAVNILSWSEDRQRILVTSYSDVHPPTYYLLDAKAGKLEWLAESRPWIDPKAMSPMTPVRYKARDGLEIPAYLTIPRGSSGKRLPLVVDVHGGPWVAGDTWRWSPEVQFLASRGYAVLQPNFRGTTRYGWKHYSSSFKQWGLEMQDDITDGAKWAIEQGIADPERICIYGASYGGYAAMMGVAKTPEVFKCAVNYVGVTDLPLLMTASWSDTFNSDFARFSNRHQIGDIDKELDRLRATSPDQLADRIKAPVLMAYGGSDVRVVPQHGTRMKEALEKAGRPPEWMLVAEEGHGYRKLENQVMFYGAMEKFLDKNIGAR